MRRRRIGLSRRHLLWIAVATAVLAAVLGYDRLARRDVEEDSREIVAAFAAAGSELRRADAAYPGPEDGRTYLHEADGAWVVAYVCPSECAGTAEWKQPPSRVPAAGASWDNVVLMAGGDRYDEAFSQLSGTMFEIADRLDPQPTE